MNNEKELFMWRISAVSAVAVCFLIWLGWLLRGAPVPSADEVYFTGSTSIALPFAVSAWWNALFIPFVVALAILLCRYFKSDNTIRWSFIIGAFGGTVLHWILYYWKGHFTVAVNGPVVVLLGLITGLFYRRDGVREIMVLLCLSSIAAIGFFFNPVNGIWCLCAWGISCLGGRYIAYEISSHRLFKLLEPAG